MSLAYWSQWSYSEIMSIHGLEEDQIDTNLDQDDSESNSRQHYNRSNIMEDLGLSWKDFM